MRNPVDMTLHEKEFWTWNSTVILKFLYYGEGMPINNVDLGDLSK